MATTLTTNDANGIGFQTNQFTLPTGVNVSAAIANRLHVDKYYKEAINCSMLGDCTMSSWLAEFGGTEFDCHVNYSLLEYNGYRNQIKTSGESTIPDSASTGTITLSTSDHSVSGAYYLPAVGNTIVLPPSGVLAEIISIAHSGANTTVLTVRQRGATAITVPANSELLVVPGQIVSDCECPVGQFRVPALPIEHDMNMIEITDGGQLCGDDLESCQFFSIPFLDGAGNAISDRSPWFTIGEQEMYRGLERKKYYERLLNPTFGVIPTIKARGMKFTTADGDGTITIADIRALKKLLRENGIMQSEYAIFAGTDMYSKWQQFLSTQGITQLLKSDRPLSGCAWIDMEYCGIKVEGLTLHIYEDCSFGNGNGLGAAGYVFPESAIWVPLGDRPLDSKYSFGTPNRNGDMRNKMFTTVYFESTQGRKYDMLVDSNGILGPRNSFGTGCRKQEWTVRSKFAFEVHCANSWIYQGL